LIDESEQSIKERTSGELIHDILNPYRFLVGYAGWGAGQLDDEIRAGARLLCPIDRELVFNTPWSDMWAKITDQMGVGRSSAASVAPVAQSSYLN
jgi:putative transcriptional regulator